MTMTYNFSTNNYNLNDAFANGESAVGSFDDALNLMRAYKCKITLTASNGEPRGWVAWNHDDETESFARL